MILKMIGIIPLIIALLLTEYFTIASWIELLTLYIVCEFCATMIFWGAL